MVKNIHIIRQFFDNPQQVCDDLKKNAEFQQFVKENENKTIEQIAKEYNLDFIL